MTDDAAKIWTRERVLDKLCRIFPEAERKAALEILDSIRVIGTGASLERIQLGVLRLVDGDLDKFLYWVDIAGRDWRDIVAFAESPREFTEVSPGTGADDKGAQAVRADDRRQYVDWLLNRPEGEK